ncbi:hypothetical protein DFS33DRAFT_1341817 [Desarmillaria ectypa]|nr:hypothetical protein DFS33DRAFT_1341817 [Desarmillaria ectypa]
MLGASSKMLFFLFLFLLPVLGAPAPQATDIGSFDSLLREISSYTATIGTFTDAASTSSGDSASATETYVTRVSLVGGTEITLVPGGATGDTAVLGSSTHTLAAPPSSDSSLFSMISGSTTSSDSSSIQSSSTHSASSSSLSSTSSASSSTSSSPSSTSTSSSSSSSSTSTGKSSSSASSTSSSSSSGTSSTSSSTTSPPSGAGISLRPFEIPPTASLVTVLLGLFFGAWIC